MFTAKQVAARFGCTEDQARALFLKNAEMLEAMAAGCMAAYFAGKAKYRNYPANPAQATAFRAKAFNFRAA